MPNVDNGHSRVSNRDPSYYLGQEDFHYAQCGFRVVRRDAPAGGKPGEKPYGTEHPQGPPKPVRERHHGAPQAGGGPGRPGASG